MRSAPVRFGWFAVCALAACGGPSVEPASTSREGEATTSAGVRASAASAAPNDAGQATSAAVAPSSTGPSTAPVTVSTTGRVAARVTLELPVADATVSGALLVVLEPGAREVTGYDLATAERRWRAPLEGSAGKAGLLLRPTEGRVLVRRDGSLTMLSAADGTIVAHHTVALDDRTYLWRHDGACALRGSCSMQLVDCDSARPIGAPLRGKMQSRTSFDGREHHRGCWGFDWQLVGKAQQTIVLLARDAAGVGTDTAFGFDAQSGQFRWRSRDASCSLCTSDLVGASPDGKSCWAWDEGRLVGFGCTDGVVRFRTQVGEPRFAIWAGEAGGGVFVANGTSAVLYEPRSGAPRWSRPVPTDVIPVPSRAALSEEVSLSNGWRDPRQLWLLDPATGAVVERRDGSASVMSVDADGAVVLRRGRRDYDHSGLPIERPDPPVLVVSRGRAAGTGKGPPNRALLSTTWDDASFAELDRDAWPIGERSDGDEVVAALMVASEPRTVRVYRLGRAPKPRGPS